MLDYSRNFVRAAIASLLLIGAVSAASSQEVSESHLKVAREAVAVSEATTQMDSILPNMSEQIKQQLINNRPDAAEQISGLVDEIAVSLAPRRGDLENEIARIYAQVFTEDELKEIIVFYNSDTGKKLIAQTPVIFRAMEQATRVWTTGLQRDFQQQVQEKISEAGLN